MENQFYAIFGFERNSLSTKDKRMMHLEVTHNVDDNMFLDLLDGYLQFGWVYVDDERVAFINEYGVRVI